MPQGLDQYAGIGLNSSLGISHKLSLLICRMFVTRYKIILTLVYTFPHPTYPLVCHISEKSPLPEEELSLNLYNHPSKFFLLKQMKGENRVGKGHVAYIPYPSLAIVYQNESKGTVQQQQDSDAEISFQTKLTKPPLPLRHSHLHQT